MKLEHSHHEKYESQEVRKGQITGREILIEQFCQKGLAMDTEADK